MPEETNRELQVPIDFIAGTPVHAVASPIITPGASRTTPTTLTGDIHTPRQSTPTTDNILSYVAEIFSLMLILLLKYVCVLETLHFKLVETEPRNISL